MILLRWLRLRCGFIRIRLGIVFGLLIGRVIARVSIIWVFRLCLRIRLVMTFRLRLDGFLILILGWGRFGFRLALCRVVVVDNVVPTSGL